MEVRSKTGPRPIRDVEQALVDLADHGACIVLDAVDPAMQEDLRTALFRAAESDRRRGWRLDYASEEDVNQRVWNLPSRDPLFCDLVEHPLALRFVNHVIGWPALLSSMSANIMVGRGGKVGLHADQSYMPLPWSRPHGVNVAVCVTDFTAENGATCYTPGSHRLNRNRTPDDPLELAPLEAPAGSMIVMEGRLWHTSGENRNGEMRAGIFSWYTLPIYLPQENWFLALDPAIRHFGSETLQTLFGFRPQILGRVYGADRL